MTIVQTNMRNTRQSARQLAYYPVQPLTAHDVQGAIEQVQAEIVIASGTPPAIVAKQIAFSDSPYTVQPTDYLVLVDTSGGSVTVNLPLAAARGNLPVEIKDASGNAQANNISIVRAGAETIDGLTTYPIASDFDAYQFKPKTNGYTVI